MPKYYDRERQVSEGEGFSIVWKKTSQGAGARPEDLMEATLERIHHLQEILPCTENEMVIRHQAESISWEQLRTMRRKTQGVHGTFQQHESRYDEE